MVEQIKTDKVSFNVYIVLRLAVIAVLIRCIIQNRWESVFVAFLALILFFIPPFVEKNFKIQLPTVLETLAFVFIFCAEILGEIEGFYVKYAFWDTMLHTVNGFMFAAFGFCLVDILNRSPKFKFQLSPVFLALTAFCFSMTIGVLWEFFEFSMDSLFNLDMQKDTIIYHFGSVNFDPTGGNSPQYIGEIIGSTIETADGRVYTVNGYLDVGIVDTMKDLFVNFIGAVVFSVIGFFYIKKRGKGAIAKQFIPVLVEGDGKEENTSDADEARNEPKDNKTGEGAQKEEDAEVPKEEG